MIYSYQNGVSGSFSNLGGVLLKLLSENVNKKQIVDIALNIVKYAGETAGQKVGRKAIDFASSKLSPKSKQILSKITATPTSITPLNAPSTGSGTVTVLTRRQNVIKIQDVVRRFNKQ